MTNKPKKADFTTFLSYFPETELPVLLTEDAHHKYSSINDPLPPEVIQNFIIPFDEMIVDEYTEYVPCFRIKDTHTFHAVVYFKAGLLTYEYFLLTFEEKGAFIAKEKIGGMLTEGENIHRAVATIEPDWTIQIVEGAEALDQSVYKASDSKAYTMELLPDGQIIFSVNEDLL